MTEKDPRGDVASQRPRSPRVPVEFDLSVEGADASGKVFSAKAKASGSHDESEERSRARPILRAVSAGATGRVQDREYRALLEKYARRER